MRDFLARRAGGPRLQPVSLASAPADVAGQASVFERVAANLRPGGRFAWNAFCFNYRIAAEVEGHHPKIRSRTRSGMRPGDNRVDIELDAGGAISLWWVTRSEWEGLIDVAGLEVEALYGWFDRRPVRRREPGVRVGDAEAGVTRRGLPKEPSPTCVRDASTARP